MSRDKNINRWHEAITPRDKSSKPWTLGSGGSWDMFNVQPISDEMLSELAQRYHYSGSPWNCRSMPLSDSDREYMFLLYYGMQGLVARMRQLEQDAARYHYLRNPDPQPVRMLDVVNESNLIIEGKDLDTAIDSAIAATQPSKKEE